MLVLTRRTGERIQIQHGDETLTILVAKATRKRCVLAIDAPDSYRIHRADAESTQPADR